MENTEPIRIPFKEPCSVTGKIDAVRGGKKILYWQIAVLQSDYDSLMKNETVVNFLKDRPTEYVTNNEFHITLLFYKKKMVLTEQQKEMEEKLLQREGEMVKFNVNGIVATSDISALIVDGIEFPTENPPHLTLNRSKKVPAVVSGIILRKLYENEGVFNMGKMKDEIDNVQLEENKNAVTEN